MTSPLLWELVFEPVRIKRSKQTIPFESPRSPIVLAEQSTARERWDAVVPVLLGSLAANPGHSVVRRPEAVTDIAKHIIAGDQKVELDAKGLAINVLTDQKGQVLGVDMREGHHRVLGAILAQRQTVGELNRDELKIFVNGTLPVDAASQPQWKEWREHIIPAHGSDLAQSGLWTPFTPTDPGHTYLTRQPNPGENLNEKRKDIWVHGANSNELLGSRHDMQFLLINILGEASASPRVAVRFLSGEDRVPDAVDWAAARASGITDWVYVRRDRRPDKVDGEAVEALRQAARRGGSEVDFNLYAGLDVAAFIAQHGEVNFLQRIQQIFATPITVTTTAQP